MTKGIIIVLGIMLLAMGILGLFQNSVLGIFPVNSALTVVHLFTGVLAIGFAASGERGVRQLASVFVVVYALLALFGFFSQGTVFGLFANNTADNYLHLFLAVLFLVAAFSSPATATTQYIERRRSEPRVNRFIRT